MVLNKFQIRTAKINGIRIDWLYHKNKTVIKRLNNTAAMMSVREGISEIHNEC
jgi:hypothetical protein